MTRWAATLGKLDEAHAILRRHPGVTVDAFLLLLPQVPCFCDDPKWPWKGGACRHCDGSRMGAPQRSHGYNLLAKLEADGRATRDRRVTPHLWAAIVTAKDTQLDETDAEVDAHWEFLADLAPADPVADYHALAADRARVQAELDAICIAQDTLVHGMVEALDRANGDTLKGLAAELGIHYTAVNGHRWRHWDRTRDRDEATG